ncbi:MAG: DUF3443 family protein [Desulfuromonadaceae bacterium]|nr:DUF3443 family protein [Desulfuromonadaceae bacterium]
MKSNNLFILLLLLTLIAGCGGGGNSTPKKLLSIVVTPANSVIAVGMSQSFSATGTFSDNTTSNLTTLVTWSSSDPSVATVSNVAGTIAVAASVGIGTTTITATSGGISGSATLSITPATLVSLTVLPANPSIVLGTSQQFSATGTFSDNTTRDLTTSAIWSSSATSVATISNVAGSTGRATAVGIGTTTITATSGGISGATTLTVTGGSSQANVLPITVNGSLCSSGSYTNKPCVSVTVCTPGTSTCQVVTDILLDTGSFGLRIFKQALSTNLVLPQVTVASGALAECIQFGDGSSDWGPVQMATVILGNEPAIQVPIQVVDATFGTRPSTCLNADASPAVAGLNGILGVGLFAQDCGAQCASSANIGIYFACNGSVCTGTTVPTATQVQNPVVHLPQDNNGVLVQLPAIPLGGVPSVNGSLILGIGTQSNNTPVAVTTYPASLFGEFTTTTTFNGVQSTTSSFIDSGSNGLFFGAPASLLPNCSSPGIGFYCPATTISLSATTTGAFGSPSGTVAFQIGNFNSLVSTGSRVFSEVGGSSGGGGFDWGLPFFFGRNVFIGIQNTNSSLGSGPYWAY